MEPPPATQVVTPPATPRSDSEPPRHHSRAGPAPDGRGAIGYVLMGYPRLSETFIASEMHRLERAGVPLRLFVIKPVEARERDVRHPVNDALRARPEYLPDTAALTLPLHRWRPRHLLAFAPALRRVARERPRGLARAAAAGLGLALRNRRTRWSGPGKVYIKELVQAVGLADRVLDAPEVRHLHAHFAHGTTTVTWHAARIAGLPFSFTGHARDIYAPDLNPRGLLRRKLEAARFAVTCSDASRRHLRRIAPGAPVHLVYHGLSADIAAALADAPPPRNRRDREGPLRVLGVGRIVAKKGFDVLVEACAVLRRRGVPVKVSIVGQDDKHAPAVRARIAELGLEDVVRIEDPMGPAELCAAYRAADVFCLPCRVLEADRDGIPNVLVEAMACGTPVVSTRVSGIPELVEDGVNGLLVAPEDPEALAGALERVHRDPELAARLAAAGERTVRERFDGDRLAAELARLFERTALREAAAR